MIRGFVQPNPSSLPGPTTILTLGDGFFVSRCGRLGSALISNPNVIMSKNQIPSVRLNKRNLDHHIYNNNGTWWIHYTVHLADYTKCRIRTSLKTRDNHAARQRRDETLNRLLCC